MDAEGVRELWMAGMELREQNACPGSEVQGHALIHNKNREKDRGERSEWGGVEKERKKRKIFKR